MNKKNILVMYYTRGVYPLRDTIKTHLYSWKSYSKHRVFYVNVALGFPEGLIRRLNIDIIIFHTIFLGMRWSPDIFRNYTEKCSYLKNIDCIKIAMPQDEFINTELLNNFFNDFGITHILTCAYEQDWPIIYDKIDFNKVEIRTVLTGYLDANTIARIEAKKKANRPREIDVGYRAWKAEYWLGEQGRHKVRVAEEVEEYARNHPIKIDVSLRNEDVLNGDDWFVFLLNCRATVGVEGGASLLDKDGSIKKRVEEYISQNPSATFEETRQACFAEDDNRLGLACISPRHLEACITETCQFLIEGTYNGILVPWKHYIPIKKDYSDIEEVLGLLTDKKMIVDIARNAFEDVVNSGKWTYKNFVKDIEDAIINRNPSSNKNKGFSIKNIFYFLIFSWKDFLNWKFIELEVYSIKHVNTKNRLFKIVQYLKRKELL